MWKYCWNNQDTIRLVCTFQTNRISQTLFLTSDKALITLNNKPYTTDHLPSTINLTFSNAIGFLKCLPFQACRTQHHRQGAALFRSGERPDRKTTSQLGRAERRQAEERWQPRQWLSFREHSLSLEQTGMPLSISYILQVNMIATIRHKKENNHTLRHRSYTPLHQT